MGNPFATRAVITDTGNRVVPLSEPSPQDRANVFVELCLRHGISANMITIAGTIAIIPLDFLMRAEIFEPALVLMLAIILTDTLDGQVARTMEKRHPGKGISALGKILDPIRDKILVIRSLMLMPWVPMFVFVPTAILEASLVLVRPWQTWIQRRRGGPVVVIGSNWSGQTKAWLQNIMILAYLLEMCRPHYLQLIMFAGSMIFGPLSLILHIRNGLRKS